jgi:hypothetical protein
MKLRDLWREHRYSAILAGAISVWSIGGFTASAYAQGCCGGGHGSAHGDGHTSHQPAADNPPVEAQPPHGGQVTKLEPLTFEVVYYPQGVRLYIFGFMPYPASAKETKGEVVMQVRDNPRIFRYPLNYVAPPSGSSEQDYLTAAVDLTHVRDGDMSVTFNLENLPLPNRPKAAFTQPFALTKVKPKVTVAQTVEADRAGIAQQKTCPITGAMLGSMGTPVKVMIGDQPSYLCCQGCVAKVKNDPEAYLVKVSQVRQSQ